jgi:hypothetical protein
MLAPDVHLRYGPMQAFTSLLKTKYVADSLGGDLSYALGASLITPFPFKPQWPVNGHLFLNAGSLEQWRTGELPLLRPLWLIVLGRSTCIPDFEQLDLSTFCQRGNWCPLPTGSDPRGRQSWRAAGRTEARWTTKGFAARHRRVLFVKLVVACRAPFNDGRVSSICATTTTHHLKCCRSI